jgi:hypothetical protein
MSGPWRGCFGDCLFLFLLDGRLWIERGSRHGISQDLRSNINHRLHFDINAGAALSLNRLRWRYRWSVVRLFVFVNTLIFHLSILMVVQEEVLDSIT